MRAAGGGESKWPSSGERVAGVASVKLEFKFDTEGRDNSPKGFSENVNKRDNVNKRNASSIFSAIMLISAMLLQYSQREYR